MPEKKVCFVSQLNSDFPRPVELIDSFRKVRYMDLNCLMISLRKQPTFGDATIGLDTNIRIFLRYLEDFEIFTKSHDI